MVVLGQTAKINGKKLILVKNLVLYLYQLCISHFLSK